MNERMNVMSIPETMTAVVACGVGDYRLETIPVPQLSGGDVLLKVEACGICAGDIKAYQGGSRFWGSDAFAPYVEPPFVPGHELLGHVVALGPTYTGDLHIGDRVVSEQIVPCGECKYCKKGRYWLCDPHVVYGFKSHTGGGFAEYVRLPEKAINYQISPDLPLEKAILIEPYACSLHAVERGRIQKGDVVVISGCGPLGLGMIAAAARLDCTVIALDLQPARLALAKQLGAHEALSPKTDPVAEAIAQHTQGYGCDVYIEATGHPDSVVQGLQYIAKGGRFVEFSVFSAPTTADWSLIGDAKEIDIYGASLSPRCFPQVIAGISDGSLKTDGVVSHTFALKDFQKGFAVCGDLSGMKVVLVP